MVESIAQVDFPFQASRTIRAKFDAGPISSDGGAVLLREVDRRLNFTTGLFSTLLDPRDARYTTHSLHDMARQRVYQIALGYEDCNDANALRSDPVLKACCGRDPVADADLASQPTLTRFENSVGPKDCYRLASGLLDSYFWRHPRRPDRVILDLDTTADPTHGQQQFSCFNAFYDEHVYLPLLVFDQDGDLLTAVLQPGKPQGSQTTVSVLERIVERLRTWWPDLPILVRADGGFSSPEMYTLCHRLRLDFLIGIGSNKRLKPLAEKLTEHARRKYLRTGQKVRVFTSSRYRARKKWPRSYRVLIKVEWSSLGPNVRFVMTNLQGLAGSLYDRYVQRGEACENSIKDLKCALKADRLSCHRFWANQFRLLLHSAAYVLLHALRRFAEGTQLGSVQMDTLRTRLLKIGVRVESTARHIWFHLSSSYPWKELWQTLASRLLQPL